MQFNRRNINKILRNGDIVSSSLYSVSSSGGGSSSGGMLSGNYLPATKDEDGYIVPHYVKFQETTYTTDSDGNETETIKNLLEITKDGLIVNGYIIASGEVSAYGSGSTSGTSVGTIDIEDHLNSTRTDAALSANQGRLLKELIDNVEVDLSDYYNKSQIDYKLSNLNVDLSNYYNKIQIDEKLENLDDYYKKQEVDNKLNDKLDKSTWNDVFSIDTNGNLKIKVDVIGEGEISAYGSGTTASTEINLGNYYTKNEVDDLLDNIDVGDIDLSNYYTKTETTSNFAPKSHSHSQYADSGHSHSLSELTSTAHTHSEYATTTALNNHTGSTTHITAAERTNWDKAYNNNHSHSNKTVLDGITSAKVNNWNDVYSDWNEVFSINSDGSLKVKVNLYGEGEISAFGSGTTENEINLENYYTKNEVDDLIDNIDIPTQEIDLTNYYTKSQTDSKLSNKSDTGHTHSFSELTSTAHTHSTATTSASGLMSATDKAKLDGITSSADSVSFTRSLTSGTKVGTITINGTATDLYCETNTDTNTTYSNATTSISGLMSATDKSKLDGITASADSVSFTRSLTAGTKVGTITINGTGTDIYCEKNTDTTYTLSGLGGASATNFNSHSGNTTMHITAAERTAWNNKSNSDHNHHFSGLTSTAHTHSYAGSSSAGGAATSANKLNTNGGSATQPVYFSNGVPVTCTTYANASVNYANSAGSAGSATNATNATTASKLSTVSKTAWGQTFWTSGGIPTSISGNMTGVGSISASGNITTSAEITAHSDRRLKSNIKPLENRGYVTPYTYIKDGKECIGFIAQDMQEKYPELVIEDNTTEEKYLSVNYMQYTAVLQKQILDLQDEINELKKIIKDKDIN